MSVKFEEHTILMTKSSMYDQNPFKDSWITHEYNHF